MALQVSDMSAGRRQPCLNILHTPARSGVGAEGSGGDKGRGVNCQQTISEINEVDNVHTGKVVGGFGFIDVS